MVLFFNQREHQIKLVYKDEITLNQIIQNIFYDLAVIFLAFIYKTLTMHIIPGVMFDVILSPIYDQAPRL